MIGQKNETWCKGEKCPVKKACQKYADYEFSEVRSDVRACDIKMGVNDYGIKKINLIRHCTNQKLFERKYNYE